jgi:hypothetical protein
MSTRQDIAAVARQFRIHGELVEAAPYGSGHINDTWRIVSGHAGVPERSILQRINGNVFANPVALMENVERVTSHLAAKVAGEHDRLRRVLTLIPARDGRAWHVDSEGSYWRGWHFIDHAHSYDAVESNHQAFQAGSAFGQFQKMLVDLPEPRLHDTIPDFHNTPKRFAAFEQAVESDIAGGAILAKAEIEFALRRKSIASVLLNADLPERVTHNDTKLNNVLIDDVTREAICVVDLDTVMPGSALYDFGDMVRTTTSPASEDERDLSKVNMQFSKFEALVSGYLAAAGSFLTDTEKQLLAFSGKLITFEQGIRFLTAYLSGDTYYKVHRDGHNLDRCRTQFKLVECIEQQEEQMARLVQSVSLESMG